MTPTAAGSPAARSMAAPVTLTHPQPLGSPGTTIRCSYPECLAKVEKRQVLCDDHLGAAAQNDSRQSFAQVRRILPALAPTPTNGLNAARPNPAFVKSGNHVLPPMEGKTPIVRRKTAAPPPRIKPQQPTPKASTPTSRDDSTSSRSPPPPVSRPSVHSPPPSPRPADEEPPRKRPRLSSTPDQSPKTRLSGVTPGQQAATRPASGESQLQSHNAPSELRGFEQHSSPRSGKQRPKEGKAAPRQSSQTFMRRLPPEFATLRFIDGPGTCPPAAPPDEARSGVNGIAGTSPRPGSGSSELSSISGFENSPFERDVRTSGSSSGRIGPEDLPRPSLKPTSIPDEHPPASPPQREGLLSTQNGYGPFQFSFSSSQPPPQKIQLSIRPPPIAETWKSRIPKPKEIDSARFDALVYSQSDAASPPPDVDPTAASPPAPKATQLKDEPLYLDIDPRIHWPQPHSQAWHAAKQAEIRARGKRKANFGRAAQSLRKQLRQQDAGSFEETLPEKIQENPAWVRMLKKLKGPPVNPSSSARSGSSRSSFSVVDGEVAAWAGRALNGGGAEGLHRKSSRKSARVTAKRVENSGVVVISGLSLTFLSSLKQ
ncbi:hypothetical protein VTJ49DRAFT_2929 [Mycothermus thermophilus]|uniref:Uncharacterized protein n=1 Tax=Humicola insolens TaxID=85995 RepID=A0ABR3VA21_HUMIN